MAHRNQVISVRRAAEPDFVRYPPSQPPWPKTEGPVRKSCGKHGSAHHLTQQIVALGPNVVLRVQFDTETNTYDLVRLASEDFFRLAIDIVRVVAVHTLKGIWHELTGS